MASSKLATDGLSKTPYIRHIYSPRVVVPAPKCGETVTHQSFKAECDINNIMAKYVRTGVVEHINTHSAQYADVSAVDFLEAMTKVSEAQDMFDDLPAKVRKAFDNDPAAFLDYVQNLPGGVTADDLMAANGNPLPKRDLGSEDGLTASEPDQHSPEGSNNGG